MASDIPKRKVKRSLQANCVENNDHQEEHQIKSRRWKQVCQPIMVEGGHSAQTSNKNLNILEHRDKRIRRNQFNPTVILDQTLFAHGSSTADSTSIIGVSRHLASSNATQLAEIEEMRGMDHQIKSRRSKRWKQVSHSIMVEENQVGQTSNENVTVFENNDKREIAEPRGERSHSYGQAFYQRTKQGSTVRYKDSGDNICTCDYCGACFWFEEAIKQTSTSKSPIYTNCCQKGRIKLPQPRPTPDLLRTLLDPNNGSESRLFKDNIRVYNSMFSFTSMGATIDYKINTGSGPYVFKISGQVHHLMGSILPSDGECPKYAQLYVYDTKNEVSNRINAIDSTHANENIKSNIVQGLIKMFDEINELVREFRTMRDKFENHSLPSLNMTLLNRQPTDSKQYEIPTTDEIGGLIVGDIGENNSDKDLIIQSNNGCLQRISRIHPKYMSLQYPILFPYGEDGYKPDLLMQPIAGNHQKKRERISMRAYIAYQIQDRNYEVNTLLKGGRLFQQFLVDSYATVEEDRLNWIRKNQKKIRSEIYKDIYAANLAGINKAHNLGQKIILPSSHTGSPRDMINNYQDAMAICRKYGNPDLFITFTCNVKWLEIRRYFANKPMYKVEDRPDIISRIFKIKLQDMITYIKSGKPFGEIEADVHTIEFQKRGLPHAHMLFWLKKNYKCYTAVDIDSIISAELPDKTVNSELFEIVSQFMIHGPCGQLNSKSPCMKDGKCSKFFPKPYNTNTIFETNTPSIYRRRNDHTKFVEKNGVHIGNNFVVPYNSELLLRYNAHINVESCSQSMLIKYLFKYINKGPDRARILFHENLNDEIATYLNCRYLTPHESVWRLFEYPIHSRHPAVQHLHIHLPLEQNIIFHECQSIESIIKHKSAEDTMLTGWFKANATYPGASELTYTEFPSHFVWNSHTNCWTPRKRYETIGRIAHVPPSLGELYFMRMLLNIQKGCHNFDSIKTINGITYSSYQEACRILGLLDDDKEWIEALENSLHAATASEIRQLFVTIILFCDVANPKMLLESYWLNMCDDILHKARIELGNPNLILPDSELRNKLLFELEQIFNKSSSSLKDHQLPMPDASKIFNLDNRLLREELDYDCIQLKREHMNLLAQLNQCQKIVYDEVITAIEKKTCNTFFVHGYGGTGKTFLWHTIINKLRSEGKIVLAVASSGIASLLLPNGRTAHSRFKIPLTINNLSICPIKKGTHLAKLIDKTELIIWDEAPMCNRHCFEALDKSLRDILSNPDDMQVHKPFGGKPILLGGDFRQILPVITGGTKEQIINASLNSSYIWSSFKIFHLTENMRLSKKNLTNEERINITTFANWLLEIGEGRIHSINYENDEDTSWVEIPNDLLIDIYTNPIEAIFHATYSNFNIHYNNFNYLKERAIVTPRNTTVRDINDYAINLLPGHTITYLSSDSILLNSGNNENMNILYPIEFLNKLEFNGLPSHELILKIGMPIMLLRNLNQVTGLCNGTRLIITNLFDRLIEAKILTGNNTGEKCFIPRIIFTATENKWPFIFKRRQFPVRPCYAMTINKSQGQSLNQVGIYLLEPVFTHGQLYVALSRVTSRSGLKILINNNSDIPNKYTKNIVYKDALQNL
ncbi:uncharacterized protein LOC133717461 [Rosa rugosa]|uniref:uncharacterized protein LOC133717461 n=1 Tax=Rosa rugosa TaxID=74645 RepID=UPI002B40CECC|nr:uncharacterized protein LOC133717461 [Rosa rugosa]XP_062000168.1 uncharacterized protein LOC133717461 [Rosa rugosa]XP_062000174.1 uncharacterized protein LOC133717461 [Rosa rugosa]XP_062000180.1 uncharacterized protein LOC133717461 [Rosa rugosa]XP_062000186.1 uncharacterized protein LOC133717461 [Rosa rugosa]XP_062000193.1 uncharacterized protein LOC133717461 [Rosa rugosa]XP_062000199.1 uncharacterized protein LOC133717461 [Rosa rugosa]XP_062000202.1 uncharacterized protein LOC133717461 [